MRMAAGALCAVALAGCATSRMQESAKLLSESVEAYNEAYRWKNYERAAGFLPADLRGPFLATYDDDSLHIEDYQVMSVDMDTESSATVTLRIRYMLLPSVNVDKRTLVQHWHKLGEAWILETEDNSIREIARGATAKKPGASPQPPAKPGQDGETRVKVTNPKGDVIREGDVGD